MSNPKKTTLQDLRNILEKNDLGEIELDVMSKSVHFLLDGHKLSSKRLTLNEAEDWLWAFIEGMRFQKTRPSNRNPNKLPEKLPCPFSKGETIHFYSLGDHHAYFYRVLDIFEDSMKVEALFGTPNKYQTIWSDEYFMFNRGE
jgi:hypothetical protein